MRNKSSDSHCFEGDKLVKTVKPIYYENFYNLGKEEKYEMMMKKSLQILEFLRDNNINHENGFFKLGIVG